MRSDRYIDRQVTDPKNHTSALSDFVLANGIAASSLRPMAKAAGTSDRMLVYHYGSKAGVMEAALEEIARRNAEALEKAIPAGAMPADILMPMIGVAMESGIMDASIAIFLELAALSLRGDKTARTVGHSIACYFRDWLAARLSEPERATELLASIEGWAVIRAVGLDAPFPAAQ